MAKKWPDYTAAAFNPASRHAQTPYLIANTFLHHPSLCAASFASFDTPFATRNSHVPYLLPILMTPAAMSFWILLRIPGFYTTCQQRFHSDQIGGTDLHVLIESGRISFGL